MTQILDRLEKIKTAYDKRTRLNFKIITPKETGFLVKVEGLYAFVSYNHFCWNYPLKEYWQVVGPMLTGRVYSGIIYQLNEDPISIVIDGKEQPFTKPPMKIGNLYRAFILQKTRYGFFVDMGHHFNWQHGSILGLLHKSALQYPGEYEQLTAGQEISTRYLGYNDEGNMILGDFLQPQPEQWTEEERNALTSMIGSVHKMKVNFDQENKIALDLLDQYQASLPVKKEFYGDRRRQVREYLEKLKPGDRVNVEIVSIGKRRRRLVVKLADWENLIGL